MYLSNCRGNVYSYGHKHYRAYSREYYDYSFQDMRLDIKADIKAIIERTGKQKVVYFGLSQGATSAIAAMSDPQDRETSNFIQDHVEVFYLLAPAVFLV